MFETAEKLTTRISFLIVLLSTGFFNNDCELLFNSRKPGPFCISVFVSSSPIKFLHDNKGFVRSETMLVCNGNDGPEFRGAIL